MKSLMFFLSISSMEFVNCMDNFNDVFLHEFGALRETKFCCLFRNSEVKYARRFDLPKSQEIEIMTEDDKRRCSVLAKRAANDGWKNHAILKIFCIESSKGVKPLKKSYIFKEGKRVVDWTSGLSKVSDTEKIKVIKSDIGNWHSEPKMIDEIKSRFVQNSDELTDIFVSLIQNLPQKQKAKYIFGFDMQSSYDMCDSCKNNVVEFFNSQKGGQTSIFQAVQTRLEEQHIDNLNNDFVVTFQSQYPYKDATYSTMFDTGIREFTYNRHGFSHGRKDVFKLADYDCFDDATQISDICLTQCVSVPAKSGVYGYIHQLGNKSTYYNVSEHEFSFLEK